MQKLKLLVIKSKDFLFVFTILSLICSVLFNPKPDLVFAVLGFVFVVAGSFFYFSARKLRKSNPKDFFLKGGVYEKVRYPEVTGVFLLCLGAVFIGENFASVLVGAFWTLVFLSIAELEHQTLKSTLGKEYESYFKRIKHRFIPGII